jgi:aspartyl-tRNA(Asn)/glutamyl-tRNA(Gln) amidotransferase subunit A
MDLEAGMWPERASELGAFPQFALAASDQAKPDQIARVFQRRLGLEQAVAAVYEDIDVLLTPTTAVAAFAAEGPMPTEIAGQQVFPALAVPFTMIANLCWNPAVSVPAGITPGGLPVGLQIQGRRHADEVVLRLARILEQVRPWPRLAPAA